MFDAAKWRREPVQDPQQLPGAFGRALLDRRRPQVTAAHEVLRFAALLGREQWQGSNIERLRRLKRLPPPILPTVDRVTEDRKLADGELSAGNDTARPCHRIGMKYT